MKKGVMEMRLTMKESKGGVADKRRIRASNTASS